MSNYTQVELGHLVAQQPLQILLMNFTVEMHICYLIILQVFKIEGCDSLHVDFMGIHHHFVAQDIC